MSSIPENRSGLPGPKSDPNIREDLDALDLDRYAELSGKTGRTAEEDAELHHLGALLKETLQGGESEVQRMVEKAMDESLKGMIQNISPELLDIETKRQLREIFKAGASE